MAHFSNRLKPNYCSQSLEKMDMNEYEYTEFEQKTYIYVYIVIYYTYKGIMRGVQLM